MKKHCKQFLLNNVSINKLFKELENENTEGGNTSVLTSVNSSPVTNSIAVHEDGQGNAVRIAETVTSLSVVANVLTYTKEDGSTDTVDLSLYLDDTNLSRLVSGTLDGASGIATFTRDDGSSFELDLSNLTIEPGNGLTADGNIVNAGGVQTENVEFTTRQEDDIYFRILDTTNNRTQQFGDITSLESSSFSVLSNSSSITSISGNSVQVSDSNGVVIRPSNHLNDSSQQGFVLSKTTDDGQVIWTESQNPTGLELLSNGSGGFGRRLIFRNPDNYGTIGLDAVDLSNSDTASTQRGATGQNSFTGGYRSTAAGTGAVAIGTNATAGQIGSAVIGGQQGFSNTPDSVVLGGFNNRILGGASNMGRSAILGGIDNVIETTSDFSAIIAGQGHSLRGDYSAVMGRANISNGLGETVVGVYSTDYPSNPNTLLPTNRMLNVGNGTGTSARSDAFSIYANGAAQFHPINLTDVSNAQAGMLIMDASDGNSLKFHNGTGWQRVSFTAN